MQTFMTSEKAGGSSVRRTNIALQTATYEIVNLFRYRECLRTIEFDVQDKKRVPVRPSFSNNPYYWALLAIQISDNQLKSSRISELAANLMYAHAHNVPSYLLVGFIYQSGGIKAIRRQKRAKPREDWLAEFGDDPQTPQNWDLEKLMA
jgi:hypothetical protein